MRRLGAVALLAAALLGVAACSNSRRPNILLIVIDSLRADRVDWYDGQRELTPFLKTLAEHGNVFWNAYAPSSWTSPSMASLWTSWYPGQHGINTYQSVLSGTGPVLPEILKQHGYVTGGFCANFVLSSTLGFGRGFDRYQVFADPPKPRSIFFKARAERVNREALQWLDSVRTRSAPVFLYLHYMEPHFPYVPPKESFDRILSQRADPQQERQVIYEMFYIHPQRWQQTDEATIAVLRDMYDGEVINLDGKLRTLFSDLQSRGFLDNAIVIITADHGEAFLEHGHARHGHALYNEEIHVPLLVTVSGQTARVDVRRPVSSVDIGPTLLDLLGIGIPSSIQGRSVMAEMGSKRPMGFVERLTRKPAPTDAAVYSELLAPPDAASSLAPAHLRSVILGTHKLIAHRDGSSEAFNLAADGGETNPSGLDASDSAALQEQLTKHVPPGSPIAAPTAPLEEATAERLRVLGYTAEPNRSP